MYGFSGSGVGMRSEEVLSLFKETEALLTGHFELRSGLHSDQFFQCAKLLEKPLIAGKLCNALVDKVKSAMQISLSKVW